MFFTVMLIIMDRIELMRTFVAVAQTGSFTGAADRLGVTPQLASKYVRALEDDLAAQLFNRSTRKVQLTETGSAFLARCVQFVDEFDDLRAEARREHRTLQGPLRITAPLTFGEMYLTDLLGEFSLSYPQLQIDLNLTDRFVDLMDDAADVAIRIGALQDSSLIARKLASNSIVLCASPKYLAQAGHPQHCADLVNHNCIVDTNFKQQNTWVLEENGSQVKVRVKGPIRINNAGAVRLLALAGHGIALCPEYAVARDLRAGLLVPVLQGASLQSSAIYALYKENRHLSAKIRVLIDFISSRLSARILTA